MPYSSGSPKQLHLIGLAGDRGMGCGPSSRSGALVRPGEHANTCSFPLNTPLYQTVKTRCACAFPRIQNPAPVPRAFHRDLEPVKWRPVVAMSRRVISIPRRPHLPRMSSLSTQPFHLLTHLLTPWILRAMLAQKNRPLTLTLTNSIQAQ